MSKKVAGLKEAAVRVMLTGASFINCLRGNEHTPRYVQEYTVHVD